MMTKIMAVLLLATMLVLSVQGAAVDTAAAAAEPESRFFFFALAKARCYQTCSAVAFASTTSCTLIFSTLPCNVIFPFAG